MFQQWISHKIAQKQLEPDEFTSSDTLLVTELSWSDIWFYIVDGKNTHTLLVARTKEEDSSIHWAQCMYIRADVQIRKVHLKFPSNHTQISYMCRWLVLCFVLFFIWLLVFFFFFSYFSHSHVPLMTKTYEIIDLNPMTTIFCNVLTWTLMLFYLCLWCMAFCPNKVNSMNCF